MGMTTGEMVYGFKIIDIQDIPEMNAQGLFARHERTGLELFHLITDEEENLFSYSFMTPPGDSTGVAHILEHSVLCGSQKYPLKDPFLVLAKQSVKTFLNAMTFPDKTVYPASSMVEADYFNLMRVYGDAVFFPLLDRWIFRQEGHRFEISSDGSVSIQGVVFNEMRGNYSSFDNIAGDWSLVSLLQGTPYAHDSGGNPAYIPELTYEQFLEFHRTYYHPVNCRVFLSGNIPTERQMKLLHEEFLVRFDAAPCPPRLVPVHRYPGLREFEVPAPATEDQDMSRVTVMVNWLLPDSTDTIALMEANLISEILLGHDGSPLSRALLESGLGEDLAPSSGLETEIRHMCFTAGLRGVCREKASRVLPLIMETLDNLKSRGVPDDELEAAVRSIDFGNREIRRSGGPFALTLMRRSLRGWIHGLDPFSTLRYIPAFEEVKRRIAASTDYIPSLLERWFLSNTHVSVVTVYPDKEYENRLEQQLEERIQLFNTSLNDEDRMRFLQEQNDFFARQQQSDSPELLERIPHLRKEELPIMSESIPFRLDYCGVAPALLHEQNTNGIGYADFAIPVDVLAPEEYPLLPLFSTALTAMALDGLDWIQTSSLCARLTGGLGTSLFSSSAVPGTKRLLSCEDDGRDLLIIRVKMLEELIPDAIALVFRFLNAADFSDTKRLADLLLEYRNDLDSSIVPAGNQYAAGRAAAGTGRAKTVDEIWNGLTQVRFIRRLSRKIHKGHASRDIVDSLCAIREKLCAGGMFINMTGTVSVLNSLYAAISSHSYAISAPAPHRHPDHTLAGLQSIIHAENECLVSNGSVASRELIAGAMQVGFAAAVLPSPVYGSLDHPVDTVFGHWLASGPLWEHIRTAGGAYGAFAHPDTLENIFIISTYRDPHPLRSLAIFREALEEASRQPIDETSLEKTINGCYSREIQPRSPSDKGFTSFIRNLYGITDQLRQKKIEQIVRVSPSDIQRVAKRLLSDWPHVRQAVVAGKKQLKEIEKEEFTGNTLRSTV